MTKATRKIYTAQFKAKVALEAVQGALLQKKSICDNAQCHDPLGV